MIEPADLTPGQITDSWRTFDCDYASCQQTINHRCRTASGALAAVHANRRVKMAAWLSRQPEVDALNALVTSLRASNDQLVALDATKDDKLDMAMQRITNLQGDVADRDETIAGLQAQIADLTKPKQTTLFGFWPGNGATGTASWADNLARVSAYLGKPQVLRDFPSAATIPATFKGSRPDIGTKAVVQSFTKIALADWLSGKAGDQLAAYLDTIPADVEFFYTPHHEPKPEWTTANIAAVWTKVLSQVPKKPNLHPTHIPMGFDWTSKRWSDDELVDGIEVLAPDIYLTHGTPAEIFGPSHDTAVKHGLRYGVSEVAKGAGYSMPGLTEEQTELALVTYLREVVAGQWNAAYITWFESNKSDGNWLMSPFTDAVAAWRGASRA